MEIVERQRLQDVRYPHLRSAGDIWTYAEVSTYLRGHDAGAPSIGDWRGRHEVNTIARGLHLFPRIVFSFGPGRKRKYNPVPSKPAKTRNDEARLGKRPRSTARKRGPSRSPLPLDEDELGPRQESLVRVSLHSVVGRLTMWYVLRIWSLIAEWSTGDSFDLSQDGERADRRPNVGGGQSGVSGSLCSSHRERNVRTLRPGWIGSFFPRFFICQRTMEFGTYFQTCAYSVSLYSSSLLVAVDGV